MKAQDLRIGNFVTWVDEDNPFNAILTITGITLGSGLLVEWEFSEGINDNTDCDFGNVKPIPLTYDWLLKFGFSCMNKKSLRFKIYIGKKTSDAIYVTLKTIGNNTEWYVSFNGFELRSIQHIHQLQNLYFALTGKELPLQN